MSAYEGLVPLPRLSAAPLCGRLSGSLVRGSVLEFVFHTSYLSALTLHGVPGVIFT